jgi:UTP--glucose-1-phosphate uridylyltransferase
MRYSKPQNDVTRFVTKMESAGLPQLVVEDFCRFYRKILAGETGMIPEHEIRPVTREELCHADDLESFQSAGKQALSNTVMIKLNGGLGTSMGLKRAKSLIKVKNGLTFLEIIVNQARIQGIRLSLMNSFNTHEDTLALLKRMRPASNPYPFLQHKFPKILKQDLSPAQCVSNPEMEWNPPGHGDVFTALVTSGTLETLLDQGITYAFISNVDNLGATVDPSLLGYFAAQKFPFMMEVADRTPNDQKGGHLARRLDGRLVLREIAQCPENDLNYFKDIQGHPFFNTNNIWVNLLFLKEQMDSCGSLELPLILNAKTLDPRDETSPEVYQVETAMGAAISLFEGATAVRVPRSRFVPVKKTSDLMVIRSDCYRLIPDHRVKIDIAGAQPPLVQLAQRYYGKIDYFDQRLAFIPSLKECQSLEVEGDVRFEPMVRLKGEVKICNYLPYQGVIHAGSTLQGEIRLS